MDRSSPIKTKKGKTLQFLPFKVENPGEVSNLIVEDYDAVLSFMNAETQKKKLKL